MSENNLVIESNLNSTPLLEKKTLILYPHFSLGDILNLSGAVRFLSKTYKITLVVVKSTIEQVKTFFDDIKDLSYHTIEKLVYYPDNKEFYDFINSKYDEVKFVGLHVNSDKQVIDAPFSFYNDLDLPFSVYKNSYVDKSIVNKEEYRLHGLEYVFISTQAPDYKHQLKLSDHKLVICPDENIYDPKHQLYQVANLFVKLPFFEYKTIIEGASELYLIDYDYFHLANKADSFNAKEIVCYCRNGNKYDRLDKRFKYEPVKTSFQIGFGAEDGLVNGLNRQLLLNRLAKRR
jgi:hypothetical protein